MSSPAGKHSQRQAEVDPQILQLLVCPLTRGTLVYEREKGELLSRGAKLAYPIRQGVPIMLPEEARPLTDKELDGLKDRA